MKKLNELPQEIQIRIKNYLKAFDEVSVTFEYGEYHFGTYLKATYGADFEYIGAYKAKDIFTEKERIENYINEFHSYPIGYKGKRDYAMLKKMDNERNFDGMNLTQWIGKINEQGNFELIERVTTNI